METEDEIGQTFDQAIRAAITNGRQAVQDSAQRQPMSQNGDNPPASSSRWIEPQGLPSEVGTARAESSYGFPAAVPTELNTWHQGRSPHASKRAKPHAATNERGADREVEH